MNEIEQALADLLDATGASRVTLRRDVPGDVAFPVTDEVLAPGAPSLRDERTVDLRTQPVALEVRAGRQVVQDDCATAYDDPDFQRMLEVYGGLAAQIVTPVVLDGEVRGIVSLHQLERPRHWSDEEIAAATLTARRVGDLMEGR
jgi:GAF domain-containing protein